MRGLGYYASVDNSGVYFYKTGHRITKDDVLEIIDPRKTQDENTTAYTTYIQEQADALAGIAADEQDRLGLKADEEAARLAAAAAEAAEEAARVAAAAAELQRQTAAINAALDDATQDGGAYTPGDRQGFIGWFINNKNFEGKTAEQIKATIYDDIDNKRYTRSEVADDLRAAFPADAGLSIEDLEVKYAGAFDLVKTGAYPTDGEQRIAFNAATTTEAEVIEELILQGVDTTNFDFTDFVGVNPNQVCQDKFLRT